MYLEEILMCPEKLKKKTLRVAQKYSPLPWAVPTTQTKEFMFQNVDYRQGFNPLECYKIGKKHKLFNLPLPQPDPIPDTKGYIIQKINKK